MRRLRSVVVDRGWARPLSWINSACAVVRRSAEGDWPDVDLGGSDAGRSSAGCGAPRPAGKIATFADWWSCDRDRRELMVVARPEKEPWSHGCRDHGRGNSPGSAEVAIFARGRVRRRAARASRSSRGRSADAADGPRGRAANAADGPREQGRRTAPQRNSRPAKNGEPAATELQQSLELSPGSPGEPETETGDGALTSSWTRSGGSVPG